MMSSSSRRKATRGVAALAAAASLGSLIVNTSTPATADPQPVLVAAGSDTTQDVMNALAGFNNGISYAPIRSSAGSKYTSIVSYDAILGAKGTCISPKPAGATFSRPNGSTNGRKALSRALDQTNWNVVNSTCPGEPAGQPIAGLVDIARSSAPPPVAAVAGALDTDPSAALTYLPFGRDALSFAYYRPAGAPVTTLTSFELNNIFTFGPATVGGVKIIPCSIQAGSGTYQSWNTAVGATPTNMLSATTQCRTAPGAVAPGEIQENDANAFKARGDALLTGAEANSQIVIGYSAANFIAQKNGASPDQTSSAPTVDLGSIDALGKPYGGTAPNLAACGTAAGCTTDFYANTKYGRSVYNVVSTARIGGPPTVNADIKTLLVGPTSAICSAAAQVTIGKFGFSPSSLPATGAGSCGFKAPNDGLRGALITGAGSL